MKIFEDYGFKSLLKWSAFSLLLPLIALGIEFWKYDLAMTFESAMTVFSSHPGVYLFLGVPGIVVIISYLVSKDLDSLFTENRTTKAELEETRENLMSVIASLKNESKESSKIIQYLIKVKKEAELAKKSEELFLANLSHQVRTPMNGIMGFANLLSKTSLHPVQQKYVRSINYSAHNLLAQINDLIEISKMKNGEIDFEQTIIDVRSLLFNVVNTITAAIEAKQLALQIEIENDVPKVLVGDGSRLKQIMINLLNNAIKYTDEGEICIRVKVRNLSYGSVGLTFTVQDHGRNISQNQLEKMMGSMSEYHTMELTDDYSHDLGLIISSKLVNLQGGNLSVHSEKEEGSTFSFTLNYPIAAKSEEVDFEPEELLNELGSLKILLVEDNKLNIVLAQNVLKKWDEKINVEIAENGVQAIEALYEDDYDLVLMDLQIPIMNGFETARYIRQVFEGSKKNIPIIALTAEISSSEKKKAFEVGMNDYVIKPFDPEELFYKIKNIMIKEVRTPNALGDKAENLAGQPSSGE